MRTRDLRRLAESQYDVVVIGGGIHGLCCAYEAASTGLKTALIDAGDFGAATSFNHQKTAHGGLRALQSLSIGRAREGVRERRALARTAPWFLRPLPFIVGTYRSILKSRLALRAAFRLDNWIGRHRNAGVEPELHLPAARLLSRTAVTKLFSGVRQDGLTGGAQWYDYQMVENDRLTFAVAAAADRAGADLANYAEARSASRQSGGFALTVHDHLGGGDVEIHARVIVNAAGARAGEVMRVFGIGRSVPLLRAMNLVTSKPAADIALAAPDRTGRMLTLVPWRGRAIVGTWQSAKEADPSSPFPAPDEIAQFIDAANYAFPALNLTQSDVTLVHHGLVPAVRRGDGSVDLLPASEVIDHAADGTAGVISVLGAKYTTARITAQRAVRLAAKHLGKRIAPSRTAATVLPGAGIADHEALAIETGRRFDLEFPLPLVRHLTRRYAENAAEIVKLMAERPELAAPVADGVDTIAAEIVYVIRHEAACRLGDIVLRRTTLGAAGHPGRAALQSCAAIAASELGWDAGRIEREILAVEGVYPPAVPQGPQGYLTGS
jgi:glycerol-3-phosphate dehydrogenase